MRSLVGQCRRMTHPMRVLMGCASGVALLIVERIGGQIKHVGKTRRLPHAVGSADQPFSSQSSIRALRPLGAP